MQLYQTVKVMQTQWAWIQRAVVRSGTKSMSFPCHAESSLNALLNALVHVTMTDSAVRCSCAHSIGCDFWCRRDS